MIGSSRIRLPVAWKTALAIGGRDAHDADLAQALGAERVDDLVVLLDEDHVDVARRRR